MKPHKNHSYSRVSTFARCQRCYALDALDPEPFNSVPAKRGSHVHSGLEAACTAMSLGVSAVEAVQIVIDLNKEGKIKGRFMEHDEFTSYMLRARPVLEKLTPVEGKVELWFRKVQHLDFVGKIDLISGTLPDGRTHRCVVDWKTTGRPTNIPDQYKASKSLQLKTYCLAADTRYGAFVHFLPTGPAAIVCVEFSEEDLDIARRWLTRTVGVIEYKWREALIVKAFPQGDESPKYDLSGFSLASPEDPLCCEKHCRHWKECLGKEM
ncbi:MAG: PD-(D/E)XK nuclease family protein [Gemmatimonadota bacterium]